jgi:hypothetical protein
MHHEKGLLSTAGPYYNRRRSRQIRESVYYTRRTDIMARGNKGDTAVADPEVEDTGAVADGSDAKPEKKAKERKRGDLPEGYVTPVGLAKALSEQTGTTIPPQMVYSYIKNAPKDDKLALEEVQDSVGATRSALRLQDGLDWWARKNERVTNRKANADAKKAAKEAKAAEKANASEASADEAE